MNMSDAGNTGHRQRLKDRFIRGEEGSRSELSLLELLLTYAIPLKDVRPLAKTLLDTFGNLDSIFEAPIEKLCQQEGIKENSATLIKLVDWIRKKHSVNKQAVESEKATIQTDLLKNLQDAKETGPSKKKKAAEPRKVIQRRGTGMFGKAMMKEAIQVLPSLPDTDSLEVIRSFLRTNLHFSAEQTRERYTSYILRRMFPDGHADSPLRLFARHFQNSQELKDVCFYRFLIAEPLEVEIIENLILPNIGNGRLSRDRLRQYLSERFPDARSIGDCSQAIVAALTAAGIAKADRTKISFTYRDLPVASFAFVMHSEFPEPGMYDIRKLDENRMIRVMLWNPEKLLHSLYELRNRGLISKISEIDNIRQFTTKYTLIEIVQQIVSGGIKA